MPTLFAALSHPVLAPVPAFATSLALGLLMGLERERNPAALAGLRTFAITALLGTLCGLLAQILNTNWLIAVGLFCVASIIINAYRLRPVENNDPGTTTEVALLLCFGLGVLCWHEQRALAVMLGIAATVLLNFKAELSGVARRLSPGDLRSMLQFAVLSFVVLPILPDQEFGPFAAFNPYQTWLMVVLISGVSLAGYLALRWFGERAGTVIVGILGGLVSSTATTLLHARQARQDTTLTRFHASVVVLANLTVLVRLSILGAIAAPALASGLATIMGCGLLAGLLVLLPGLRGQASVANTPVATNPTELATALGFAAMYSLVLLGSAWLTNLIGPGGLYAMALVSGATDVDAITLSSLRMFNQQRVLADTVLTAVTLAVLANTLFKLTLAFTVGGTAFGRRVMWSMLAALAGSMAALAWHLA